MTFKEIKERFYRNASWRYQYTDIWNDPSFNTGLDKKYKNLARTLVTVIWFFISSFITTLIAFLISLAYVGIHFMIDKPLLIDTTTTVPVGFWYTTLVFGIAFTILFFFWKTVINIVLESIHWLKKLIKYLKK